MSANISKKPSWRMSRRTFLVTVSLGMAAGLSNQSLARISSVSDDEVLDSLLALSKCELWDSKVDLYIRAAIALQSAEMGDAQSALYLFAHASRKDISTDGNIALIALCRMLFTKSASVFQIEKPEFRSARIGDPGFFAETNYDDWPLEPIEIIDGVPFVVVDGYALFGTAESADKYIEYCIENCDWNNYRFTQKDQAQKKAALDKLLTSPKWKQSLPKRDKEFLSRQIR